MAQDCRTTAESSIGTVNGRIVGTHTLLVFMECVQGAGNAHVSHCSNHHATWRRTVPIGKLVRQRRSWQLRGSTSSISTRMIRPLGIGSAVPFSGSAYESSRGEVPLATVNIHTLHLLGNATSG